MTHTPGPWKYTRWTHHIVDSTGTGIAFEVAHEDDARLIAAAPQLLEAAKEMTRCLNDQTTECTNEFIDALTQLEAAIAAAEGAP